MTILDALTSFFAAVFGVRSASRTEPSGATVPASTEIYDLRPTPGPLTTDAPANFPAQLSYLTWNVLGADVSRTPQYPTSVGSGNSSTPDWRRRARTFLDDLFGRPTPPTPPIVSPTVTGDQSPPGWFDVAFDTTAKPIQPFTDQSPPGWFDVVFDAPPKVPQSVVIDPSELPRNRGVGRLAISSSSQTSKDLTPKPTIINQPPPAP